MVCVSVKGGSPEVIDRRRVELIEPGLPKQPYEHETVGMSAAEAERLVQEVRDSAAHCAERALSRLRSGLGTTREIVSIARDLEVRAKIRAMGCEPTGTTPEELKRLQRADFERWGPVVKASGITVEN